MTDEVSDATLPDPHGSSEEQTRGQRLRANALAAQRATGDGAAQLISWIKRTSWAFAGLGLVYAMAGSVIVARWLSDEIAVPLMVVFVVAGLVPAILIRLALKALGGLSGLLTDGSVFTDVMEVRSVQRVLQLGRTLGGLRAAGAAPTLLISAGLYGVVLVVATLIAVPLALLSLVI